MAITRFPSRPGPRPARLDRPGGTPGWCMLGAVALAWSTPLAAQGTPPVGDTAASGVATAASLPPVTITGRATGQVGGFGDDAALRTPQATTTLGAQTLADAGVHSLAQVTRFDASVSDAYNAPGYWSFLSIRGLVADNQYNFRRDGLPINAETALALDNKQRVEILKGTSGMLAGVSSPAGLVNLVVKRPELSLRSVSLGISEGGGTAVAIDVSERGGPQASVGLRINAAAEQIRPQADHAHGQRRLLGVAADWRITPATLVEAEFETSHQSQPSVPGFSLLGSVVPDARQVDPRTNLNNQAWSRPVVFDADTASLRVSHALAGGWSLVAHAASQQLHTDDRIAFPAGCRADGHFDRYCNDGSVDLYDFRSDGERRRTDALDVSLKGSAELAGMKHQLAVGVAASHHRARFQEQVFNFAGIGRVDASVSVPAAPLPTAPNTNREERSTEFYGRDKVQLAPQWQAWLGLRNSHVRRLAQSTDGTGTTSYAQGYSTPWLALSHEFAPQQLVYASWGEGVETHVVPNLPQYVDAGRPLAPVKSRQVELGIKGANATMGWSATAFAVRNPQVGTSGTCETGVGAVLPNCVVSLSGTQRHRGVELTGETGQGAWTTRASAMLLQARIVGSGDAARDGLRPANVPARTLRLETAYAVPALPGLALQAALSHEGQRMALPDNSAQIPAWSRLDLAGKYAQNLSAGKLTWRFGLDNATNRRAWQESPYKFGHAYLFPMAARTWRLNAQFDL